LLIVGTSSCKQVLHDMGMVQVFNMVLHVPGLSSLEQLITVLKVRNIFSHSLVRLNYLFIPCMYVVFDFKSVHRRRVCLNRRNWKEFEVKLGNAGSYNFIIY
jgi:hypothetical protein